MFRNPTTDLIVILVIVLLIFGPKRLPGLGKQLGQGLREFKESITGDSDESPQQSERPQLGSTPTLDAPRAPEGAPAVTEPAHRPADPAGQRESAEIGTERSS